jgi:quercetin dioxygenase-like cupin family protein
MRTFRLLGACLAAGLLLAACGDDAQAETPPPAPAPVELARATAPDGIKLDTKGPVSVVIKSVPFVMGKDSGWHTHDGVEIALVSKGEVTLVREGACAPKVYKAGDVVQIPANTPHLARNDGPEEALVITTHYLKPGAPDRADAAPAC